jgi:hypothetical protein
MLGNECPGPSDDCICPSAAHCLMRIDQSSCPKGTRSIDYLAYCRDAFTPSR